MMLTFADGAISQVVGLGILSELKAFFASLNGVHSRLCNSDNKDVQSKNETEEPSTRQHPRPPGRTGDQQQLQQRNPKPPNMDRYAANTINLSGCCHE